MTSRPTILVADDNPGNMSLIIEMLRGLYKIKVATGGQRVLEIARSDMPPDLLLLDIMMPDLDGFEVCRQLKQDPKTADIPVIFLTSKITPEDEEKGLLIGAADYITKPIHHMVLKARIQTQLRLKQYAQDLGFLVQKRTQALEKVNQKLEKIVATGIELGYEREHHVLMRKILLAGKSLLHCDSGILLLKTEQDTLRFAIYTEGMELPTFEVPLYDPQTGLANVQLAPVYCVVKRTSVVINDVPNETHFDMAHQRAFDSLCDYKTLSLLSIPLASRGGKIFGVMQFCNALDPLHNQVVHFDQEQVRFVEALATQAAMLLDNFQLGESQRQVMDAFIQLLADAIDAKSQHTGGHCARVPELAVLLAQAACDVKRGPLANFQFHNEDEWREFRIGAWLHDCGKLTTPEFVVDKATKLETMYNRIHEIRTRFEVLRRDAEIVRLQAIIAGTEASQANADFEAVCQQLDEEFALLAKSNVGSESMSQESVARIRQIANRTWLRTFDDRLGLSYEELRRYEQTPAQALPVQETLLADKMHHIIARESSSDIHRQFNFKVPIPEHLYNFGEVYNLTIRRGTLSEEERFKINEHIIQTIVMLERLPLPENLRRVPEYAGTHHETLLGTGYPRQLSAPSLSIPARIMAIADIFEALTASDRPYKSGKPLSEAIRILATFKQKKHIDPDLFDLFLTSGVYLQFARRFLQPEQIDDVRIESYLTPVD
jgi:response regulator RpfG family c-di-GMP phosphodiesterase